MAKAMVKGPTEHTAPRWAGDFVGHDSILPFPAKIDTGQTYLGETAVQTVVVGAAGAAVGATTVPVDALAEPIPAQTRIDFGDKGTVVTSAAAADAAVTITVEPLETALVDNDEGEILAQDLRTIPSGVVVGRTFAERAANAAFGPAADADDEIYILMFDCNPTDNDDIELYRPGKVVKENYLPAFGMLSAAVKAAIRTKYVSTIGKE